MLTFERNLAGLLRYRKVFFPSQDQVTAISRTMSRNDIVRILGLYREFGPDHLVTRGRSLTASVDLTPGPEAIWNGMKKKSCRYEIQRAEKMLASVEIDLNSERACRDFLVLYNTFARAKGPVPKISDRQFVEFGNAKEVFVLYQNNEPLCCHLLLCDGEAGIAKLLYSGSRRLESTEYQAACGALNRYLHWFEMQRYCAKGFIIYDLGGIRYPNHPTARFKLSFGAVIKPEYYYLLAGIPRLARLGNAVYSRFFQSAVIANRIAAESRGEVDSVATN